MKALFILQTPQLRGAYRMGQWKARYMHVSTTPREIVRSRVAARELPRFSHISMPIDCLLPGPS